MTGQRIASDGNKALIAMYQALQQGWEPPEFVSEEEWKNQRLNQNHDDPLTAFIGLGCSFGGKWFGGYARSEDKTCYAATSKRSLMKQLPKIKEVYFELRSFQDWQPEGCLTYCDPPYEGTSSYSGCDKFDHKLFWQTMREWTKTNTIVVSEYSAPDDFVCVKEMESRMGLTTGKNADSVRTKRTEKLFIHESQTPYLLASKGS